MTPDFTCECAAYPAGAPEPERHLYIVVGHDGSRSICSYCDECAQAARDDWNGETESCTRTGIGDLDG